MWRYSIRRSPCRPWRCSTTSLDEAVVGGTSLGANITLELASIAPERVRGMLLEMPALDNALPECAVAFTPLLFALTFGEPAMRQVARLTRAVPRRVVPGLAEIVLDWLSQEPGPSGAVLQGTLFGRTAPDRTVRQTLTLTALVMVNSPRSRKIRSPMPTCSPHELPERPADRRKLADRAADASRAPDRADSGVDRECRREDPSESAATAANAYPATTRASIEWTT